ncbi:cupin domain [Kribbella sp. VKM Ac-2527]|uniref:Cupin domain n=1 Tax=Kribbella caucasensis TaxID=2512215 RepID=A0A4R6KC00_9ACTN|nr:cupin domain-containing protein [Kribbella sp. VKM Ac-2527]TDO46783.1 cupin domain [Kribbella sp. VKM Ac-2527]
MSAGTVAATTVKVVQPGEGRRGGLMPGVGVIFKIDGVDSGGALAVVEHPFEVGGLVPPHVHHREDEISIVLEGEIGFRSEDKEIVLGPGGYIVKPRGEVHAMWNAGPTPARMIEIISPAGLEELFRTVVGLTERGEAEMSKIVELANRYEVPIAEPEWFADVIQRYQLSMPTP